MSALLFVPGCSCDDNDLTETFCTTNENGLKNGLGVSRFSRFTLDSSKSITIRASKTSGLELSDPDLYLFKSGQLIGFSSSATPNAESLTTVLGTGNYVLELMEYVYTYGGSQPQTCYNVDISSSSSSSKPAAVTKQVIPESTKTLPGDIQYATSSCPVGSEITVSGTATYDLVSFNTIPDGLDMDNPSSEAIKEAVVEVICAADSEVYSSDTTGNDGSYSLLAPSGSNFFVRVKAQMKQTGPGASWDFQVVDNTSVPPKALYVMDGGILNNTISIPGEDLHAGYGWDAGTSSYTPGTRVAAPFAILDSVYQAYNKVLVVDPNAVFPPLLTNWSENNVESDNFNAAVGQILGTHFNGTEIYILGAEDLDTDEYDRHVIIHEWGHYFEEFFSRSDSYGGPHGFGNILDIRVAFGEGWGNAWSSMVSGESVYRDSGYTSQASDLLSFDLESNNCVNAGWYSECSVQSILYDLFDGADDGLDTISHGFSPIYDVLTGAQKTTSAMTSLFSFIKSYKDNNGLSANEIDTLVGGQNIDPITDIYGDSEISNNPGQTDQLPIYTRL